MFKRKSKSSASKSSSKEISVISVSHGLHVDLNFEWSGPEAASQFVFGEKLGEGSFGAVYRASHKTAGIDFAIKTIPIQENDELGDIEHEIEILKKCSSPNIVSYYGCFRNGREFWILMDYCAYGSLRDLMDHLEQPLEERVIAHVCMGSLAGLAYLHSKNIIHRDIKAANILIDGNGTPKLADFGVSRQMTNTWAKTMSLVGTPLWMAPEVAKMQSYSFSADIWSMGITAMELAEFYPPYADVSPMRALILITRNPPPKLSGNFTSQFNDFVSQCLNKDPDSRPDAMTLIKHPFISKSRDGSGLMMSLLKDYSSKVKKLQKTQTKSKRAPPTNPPPMAPPTRKGGDTLCADGDSGTVVMHTTSSSTVVMHTTSSTVVNGDSDGTVVYHKNDDNVQEDSGTVIVRKPLSPAAIGSMAQRGAMKRHFTIISPTSDSDGLVSKRDFCFIFVGVGITVFVVLLLTVISH